MHKADREAESENQRRMFEEQRLERLEQATQHKIDQDILERQNAERIKLERRRAKAEEVRYEEQRAREAAEANKTDIRMKRAHDIMKSCLYAMPADVNNLTLYLDNVDRLFDINHVDEDLRVALLTPHLTESARKILLGLPASDLDTYAHWKSALLREHRLTPCSYRQNYMQATRDRNETCTAFSTRLSCLLKYYLDSRGVKGSYDKLVSLLLSDRLKDSLSNQVRYHICEEFMS